MVGNKFYAEYLINNEFNDIYVNERQLTSTIEETAGKIELSVDQKLDEEMTGANIILQINKDISEAKVNADKIGLEGYTTINNGFTIDLEGNASISNGAVKINTSGIQMADETAIIGGNGVYTSLSFSGQSDSYTKIAGEGNFQTVGFSSDASGNLNRLYSYIDVFVPQNFTLSKAYLNLQHLPFIVLNTTGSISGYGICSNMKLYKGYIQSQQIYVSPASDTSIGVANLTEINVLGSSGWTPARPTSISGVTLEQKSVEINISNFNTDGNITRFAIGSSANTPSITDTDMNASFITAFKNSGAVIATIVLIGYLKGIEFS